MKRAEWIRAYGAISALSGGGWHVLLYGDLAGAAIGFVGSPYRRATSGVSAGAE